ncbi:MAG: hypothetical protein AABW65_03305 [Nanoarchaeota archaeon]
MRHHFITRKIIATLAFSLIFSIGLIIHGIFFYVDFTQLKRLTIEGFFLTFFIVFPTLLLLEWIFDLDNKKEFQILERRVHNLETKRLSRSKL